MAKHHVLVVDDDALLRRVVGRMLAATYRITSTESAVQALALIEAEAGAFDAILCDLMMPGMSGVDLWDRVRERWPHLGNKFVFLTGGIDETMRARLTATARPVLSKPFHPDDVREAIRVAIGKRNTC